MVSAYFFAFFQNHLTLYILPHVIKDGKTIYTTDVIVEEHEFAQNKDSGAGADSSETPKTDKDGFMEAKDGENPFD